MGKERARKEVTRNRLPLVEKQDVTAKMTRDTEVAGLTRVSARWHPSSNRSTIASVRQKFGTMID
jgi:hypothetical protein